MFPLVSSGSSQVASTVVELIEVTVKLSGASGSVSIIKETLCPFALTLPLEVTYYASMSILLLMEHTANF